MLEVLDKLAEETALRYVRGFESEAHVVTAAMDDLEVRNPPDVERDIILHARINNVGRTSMEVGVRIEQEGAPNSHIASCYFTMVARKDDHSILVQPLDYETEDEKRRSRQAAERRSARNRGPAFDKPTIAEYAMLHELHRELESRLRNTSSGEKPDYKRVGANVSRARKCTADHFRWACDSSCLYVRPHLCGDDRGSTCSASLRQPDRLLSAGQNGRQAALCQPNHLHRDNIANGGNFDHPDQPGPTPDIA
jgi:acyl-CoA hydrolase